jgi:hypothetical protein
MNADAAQMNVKLDAVHSRAWMHRLNSIEWVGYVICVRFYLRSSASPA